LGGGEHKFGGSCLCYSYYAYRKMTSVKVVFFLFLRQQTNKFPFLPWLQAYCRLHCSPSDALLSLVVVVVVVCCCLWSVSAKYCGYCYCTEHPTAVSLWAVCRAVVRVCIHSATRTQQKNVNIVYLFYYIIDVYDKCSRI